MVCTISCAIFAVFLIGMIYMSLAIDKCALSSNFMKTLTPDQQKSYEKRLTERKYIYYGGFILGFILSICLLNTMSSYALDKTSVLCMVGSTMFLTSYFFYILFPKKPLMIIELNDEGQRKEWAKLYKKMQFHYHTGLVLGIISVLGFANIYCI